MPQIINTNILAINAQRQLNKSQGMQTTSIERLSSGLRINSAKDDAAGLAISTRFDTQVRGLNQAIRNANDGISLAQTAEGSLQEMTNILQRMRELAVQSANDSNSDADRVSIQAEVDQLFDEIERIADVTEFNGVKLLDGTAGTRTFQVGANQGDQIDFQIDSVTTNDLNLNGFSALGELNGGRLDSAVFSNVSISSGQILVNGVGLGSFTADANTTIDDVEDFFNDSTGLTGVTATAYNAVAGGQGVSGVTSGTLQINGDTVSASGSMAELVDNINRDVSGITAAVGAGGNLQLSNDTGNSITIGSGTTTAADLAGAGFTGIAAAATETYYGYLSLSSFDGSEVDIGIDATDSTILMSELQSFGFNDANGSDEMSGGEVTGAAITATDSILINDVELGVIQKGTDTSQAITAADIAFGINAIKDETGVSATATTSIDYQIDLVDLADTTVTTSLLINGIDVRDTAVSGLAQTTLNVLDNVVTAVNASGIEGVRAEATGEGELRLISDVGVTINVVQTAASSAVQSLASTTDTTRGILTLQNDSGGDIIVTSNATTITAGEASIDKLGLRAQGGSEQAIGLGLSVTTVENANVALSRIDDALDTVSSVRANLGAFQNRLTSTIANLENVSQNLSSANSRIKDADFATETSQLTKSQILQQAGIAMLAQANASQQNVLSLLG